MKINIIYDCRLSTKASWEYTLIIDEETKKSSRDLEVTFAAAKHFYVTGSRHRVTVWVRPQHIADPVSALPMVRLTDEGDKSALRLSICLGSFGPKKAWEIALAHVRMM